MRRENRPVFTIYPDWDAWCGEIEEAIEAAKNKWSVLNTEEGKDFYMGESYALEHSDFLNIKNIEMLIERMQEEAYAKCGECTETYLCNIPEKKLIDLHKVISSWLDENISPPEFCTVKNIVQIDVEFDSDGNFISYREV